MFGRDIGNQRWPNFSAKTTMCVIDRSVGTSANHLVVNHLKSCQNYLLKKVNLEDSNPNGYHLKKGLQGL